MKRFLLSCLFLVPLLVFAQAPNANVIAANQVMVFAGLPLLPSTPRDMNCSAWDNVSKGVFATWTTDEAGLDAFVGQFGEEITPIPEKFLVPPKGSPGWFNISKIEKGGVVFGERRYSGGVEKIRVYVDREAMRIYFYYRWT